MTETHPNLGLALLTTAGLGTLLCMGCAAAPQTPGPAPTPAAAESHASAETSPQRLQRDTTAPLDAVRFGLVSRTTALIGMRVKDRSERMLGVLEDLILDLPSGQVLVGVISTGADGQVTPVPARSFWTGTKNKLLLNADRKRLESAPRFARADLARIQDLDALSGTFRYFNQDLPRTSGAGLRGFCSATEVVRLSLMGQASEPLGRIEDVMVDLPMGRIVYLLIQPGVGPDTQSVRYVVPPQAVHSDANGQALALKADQAQFLAGPHFQKEYWTDMSNPELAAAMMRHYALDAAALGQPDPTRQPARASVAAAGGPAQTAPAQSDAEITKAVVTEIVRIDAAFSTREMKINTSAGQVTLSGRVRTNKQKAQLAAAAARVVGEVNVINQLETH
jgi:sporulation protein YlmC with PRC-barrel domain